MTGLVLRGSNELLSASAADDLTIWYTDISEETHTDEWGLPGAGVYGMDYDAATDTVYYTDTDGNLRAYDPTGPSYDLILDGLDQPLDVTVSESGSHLVYTDRDAGTVSAYELATGDTFPLVNGGAHFGVALWGDPEPPPPMPAADLPIVDTFDSGTLGNSIVDQPTSDGKATWRAVDENGQGVDLVYDEDEGNGTLLVRSEDGVATLYLEGNVRDVEKYWIRIGKLSITGDAVSSETAGIGDNTVAVGTRRISGGVQPGYQWNPASYFGADRVAFYYRPGSEEHNGNQGDPLNPVTYTDVVIQVEGSKHHFSSNEHSDAVWRDTEAEFGGADNQRVFQIRVESIPDTGAFVEMELSDISIEVPPEPPPAVAGWQKIDDFDDRTLGDIDGEDGWSGTKFTEVIENPYGPLSST